MKAQITWHCKEDDTIGTLTVENIYDILVKNGKVNVCYWTEDFRLQDVYFDDDDVRAIIITH